MVFRIYNVQDSNGVTPLMIAVKKQNTSAIKHLVAHKEVDLNLRDSKGNNVYHYAARTEKEIIEVTPHLQIVHNIQCGEVKNSLSLKKYFVKSSL